MRIFLAGAGGAIGRRLTPLLVLMGHEVTGTTRSADKAGTIEAMCARPMVVDVFDAAALKAAVIAGVPLVVSTSSQSAYGFAYQFHDFLPHYLPLDEKHPDLSQDAYGLSKMVGEQIAHAYHRRTGLRVCSIRPPWVLAPEELTLEFQRAVGVNESEWNGGLYAYVDARDLFQDGFPISNLRGA